MINSLKRFVNELITMSVVLSHKQKTLTQCYFDHVLLHLVHNLWTPLFEDPMTFPIGCDLMSKENTDYFKTIYILYNSFTQSNILELGMTRKKC